MRDWQHRNFTVSMISWPPFGSYFVSRMRPRASKGRIISYQGEAVSKCINHQ